MKTNEAYMLSNFLHTIAKDCKGKLGYAVARNIRLIDTELTEYNHIREELIKKHGKQEGESIVIENGSEGYFKFLEEIKQYEDIEIQVELMRINQDILEQSDLSADVMISLIDYMAE